MSKPNYRDFRATVSAVQRISPSFVRVTLADEGLRDFGDTCLDQRIKVVFPLAGAGAGADPFATFPTGDTWYLEWRELPEAQRNVFRTYTPAAVRRDAGELDIDIAVHGEAGPGSAWALHVQPGDSVMVWGPDATVPGNESVGVDWTPGAAERFLLAGDETAVPAIINILRVLDAGATGQAFLEVPEQGDVREVEAPAGVEVVWLPRDEGQTPGERLARELPERLTVQPGGVGAVAGAGGEQPDVTDDPEAVPWEVTQVTDSALTYAWFAAESSAVKALRRHLVRECGWDKRQVAFMGYWKQGVSQV
ncbi:siderophore-interacting protein [Kytococcus sedentarius]|uniref:siderophore-interacting protein n=1 Tax=Kytococcus sedentarius TaxID=1276 RepID=UPI0035BC1B41